MVTSGCRGAGAFDGKKAAPTWLKKALTFWCTCGVVRCRRAGCDTTSEVLAPLLLTATMSTSKLAMPRDSSFRVTSREASMLVAGASAPRCDHVTALSSSALP